MKRVDYRNMRGFEERIQLRYKIAEICRLYLKYSVLGNKVGKVTAYLYFLIKKSGGKIAFQRSVYLLSFSMPTPSPLSAVAVQALNRALSGKT